MNGDGEQESDEQQRRNRLSQSAWDAYEPHRRRVTALLLDSLADRQDAQLCVLGAGNANDVDLADLSERFHEIHLVDLDAEALQFGARRLSENQSERVILHGGVDVAGLERADAFASDDDRIGVLRTQPDLQLPGPFQVVASTGLLTQLFDAVTRIWPLGHPRLVDAIGAVRRAHLRLLLDLAAPGGTVVVVVEIVSSDTFPNLRDVPEGALPPTIAGLIEQRNFFTGANPAALKSLLESDEFRADVARVDVSPPWVWQFIERDYAVFALTIERR